jgi:hypothetical protein
VLGAAAGAAPGAELVVVGAVLEAGLGAMPAAGDGAVLLAGMGTGIEDIAGVGDGIAAGGAAPAPPSVPLGAAPVPLGAAPVLLAPPEAGVVGAVWPGAPVGHPAPIWPGAPMLIGPPAPI